MISYVHGHTNFSLANEYDSTQLVTVKIKGTEL